ncbi:DUF3265 domain-containing protein [Vibrio alginolyticus]|nr:DUF3265 domain-containing protein [Vibrio alginolyticus]
MRITNCSRVIRHAWHFYHALVLVVKALCSRREFCSIY